MPDQEPYEHQLGLRDRLEKGPGMNMKYVAEMGLAIHWVQQNLISALRITVLLEILKQVGNL
jgi:hypothetical protein